MHVVRRIANSLPESLQRAIRARRFGKDVRSGRLTADEPEYDLLHRWVRPGDVAFDVGANYGVYTARLSQLVGPSGLVIAAEPLPRTFRSLVAHSQHFPYANTVLLNAAFSDRCEVSAMTMPVESRISVVYQAHLSASGEHPVLTMTGDSLKPEGRRVTLVKIDTEGHELAVLEGMRSIIERDRPVLIVENSGPGIADLLARAGYDGFELPKSPNRVYQPRNHL